MRKPRVRSMKVPTKPHCPHCGKLLDAATSLFGAGKPKPLDFSFCAYCASALRWTDTLQLRLVTPAEIDALNSEALEELAMARRCATAVMLDAAIQKKKERSH